MKKIIIAGEKIDRPLEKLLRKFGLTDEASRVQWPTYDGYLTPAEREGNYSKLELEDLLITSAQNSRLRADAIDNLRRDIEAGRTWIKKFETLLEKLEPTLDIADASDEQLDLIEQLLTTLECSVYGIGPAVSAKVLDRKRPGSIPMLDSVVTNAMQRMSIPKEEEDSLELTRSSSRQRRALRAFRVVCSKHRAELARLAREFGKVLEKKHSGVFSPRPLRLVEVLVWLANSR